MTTAPTPSDAERLAELIEKGPQRQGDALIATTLRRLHTENERLRADQAQAMSEASSLAMSLFRKHYSSDPDYASGAVKFGLCDDLRGVISQIDNMSTGLARAELEARKPLPLSDAEIIAAQEAIALSRSRIGLPCTRCGTGKYRADRNAYHDFHRCDNCMHVPMWGDDGKELGPPTCTGESS